MERLDKAPRVATGYQEPDIEWYNLGEETLLQVINDDKEVAGLIVLLDHVFPDGEIDAHPWSAANRVGNAVGDSRCLRKLEV